MNLLKFYQNDTVASIDYNNLSAILTRK